MEMKHLEELEDIWTDNTIKGLEISLHVTSSNTSLLQQQQLQVLESVQNLVSLISQGKEGWLIQDCMDILQSGFNLSGVYTLHINNLTEPKKVTACNGHSWSMQLLWPVAFFLSSPGEVRSGGAGRAFCSHAFLPFALRRRKK
uniref:Uncharacterized protein n=1 Tax=Pseudonaja textilis TaxID=8673 RepID=A0A670Y092_PSETE